MVFGLDLPRADSYVIPEAMGLYQAYGHHHQIGPDVDLIDLGKGLSS